MALLKRPTVIALVASVFLRLDCVTAAIRKLGGPREEEDEDTRFTKIDLLPRKLQQAVVPILLQVKGQPGLLNEYEYIVLEETVRNAYNSLVNVLCPDTTIALESVVIDRDVTSYTPPGDGVISRTFSLSSRITLPNPASTLFSSSQEIQVRRKLQRLNNPKSRRLSLHGGRKSGKGGKGGKGNSNPNVQETIPPWDNDGIKSTDCPGLTEQAFTLALREAVRAKSGELGSVSDVINVAEMEPVACDPVVSDFTSDVVITFSGNPALWTPAQVQVLAKSFQQTYHSSSSLNPDTCDLLFRGVSNVSVLREEEFNRRLDENKLSHKSHRVLQTGTTFAYLYRINGECRGCDSNARLFDQGSSGRMLQDKTPSAAFADGRRHLQNGECMCPVTASKSRSATSDEFRTAYETFINILKQENVIDHAFIESVVGIKEVEDITEDINELDEACEPTETFRAQVSVGLVGNPDAVEASEIQALETGFLNTFKSLSAKFCDPLFRTPIEVTIDTWHGGRVRRLQSSQSSTFAYQYIVKGLCHGCDSKTRLFGQSAGRALTSGSASAPFQNDELCDCNLDSSLLDRPLTANEFAVAYNETVKNLSLANIHHVVNVEEQEFPTSQLESEAGNEEQDVDDTTLGVVASTIENNKSPTHAPAETTLGVAAEPTDRPTCSPKL